MKYFFISMFAKDRGDFTKYYIHCSQRKVVDSLDVYHSSVFTIVDP